jgi:hypothetical protein
VKTPFLGIVAMRKGHVDSLDRNVLVVWVRRDPRAPSFETAERVFQFLVRDLDKTDLQLVVINNSVAKGNITQTDSWIFVKGRDGSWSPTHDANLIDKVIQAGLR